MTEALKQLEKRCDTHAGLQSHSSMLGLTVRLDRRQIDCEKTVRAAIV
jgi:hypothetical protein